MKSRVTEGRIRDVCMINPNVNPKFQQFKLEKLVKDMNTKFGTSIEMTDKAGRARSVGDVCGEIYDYIPDTSICFMKSNGKMPTVADVARVAKQMNDRYGSSIIYYVDPMNPKSGYRPVEQICEQMHDVASVVRRKMEDDLDVVRNRLKRHINKLMNLQKDFSGKGLISTSSAMNAALGLDPVGNPTIAYDVDDYTGLTKALIDKHNDVLLEITSLEEKDEEAIKKLEERAARKEISKPEVDIRLDILNNTHIGVINNLFENMPIAISGNKEKDYENLVAFYLKIKRRAQQGDEHAAALYKKHRDAFKIIEAGFSPLHTSRDQIRKRATVIAEDSESLF